jgi:hypothetical protein
METITIAEFLAEIETIFANYTDSNDLDRISIKGWVIDRLRMFGKNICDYREMVVGVKNSRALLPENFKSLSLALKIDTEFLKNNLERYKEIPIKKYITHDVVWDSLSQSYIKDNCQSQEVIESLIIDRQPIETFTRISPLSLTKGIQKSTLDIDCYNLHPSIRNSYEHQINITNRTINTNFKTGLIYLAYNSLPSDEEGEIVIPIISTGHLKEYIENYVKIKIAENLILNNRNPQGAGQLLPMWRADDNKFFIQAKSETNWGGLDKNWQKRIQQKKIENINRFNLPR